MKDWPILVSEVREMAKEAEDFTNRLYILASTIQRKGRDFEVQQSAERMKETHQVSLEILGMPVKTDPSIPPGEIRMEKLNEREPGTTRIARQDSRDTQEKE